MKAFDASRITKRCSLLQRRADLPVDAFRAHWAGPHAAIARQAPGIACYTQNRIEERLWAWSDEGPAYDGDGIVELEFRDGRSILEANASEVVQRLLPEDELRFLRGITLCRVPSGARQTWPGRGKAMLAARLAGDPHAALERLEAALRLSGCARCSVDPVVDSFHRDRLDHEAAPPQVFASLWFDPQVDLAATIAAGPAWLDAAGHCIARGSLWRCDPLVIIG